MNSAVTIVVPCYNEQFRLRSELFLECLRAHRNLRLLLVDDGSRDDTFTMLQKLARSSPRAQVLKLAVNGGKAEAIRAGLRQAVADRPDLVGYLDADLATPLSELPRMVSVLDTLPNVNIVLGSRQPLIGRSIRRDPMRRRISVVFSTLRELCLPLGIRDTQCGAKLFRSNSTLQLALEQPFQASWIFDVELLLRLRALVGPSRWRRETYELPLDTWNEVPGSKLRPVDYFRAVNELAGLVWRYRRWRPTCSPGSPSYEPPVVQSSLPTPDRFDAGRKAA